MAKIGDVIYNDGEPIYCDPLNECSEDPNDWFCAIETKEEELVYDMAIGNVEKGSEDLLPLWNKMINYAGQGLGLCWGEDDIYGYFRSDEAYPEIGEEWTDDDGDKWVRVE